MNKVTINGVRERDIDLILLRHMLDSCFVISLFLAKLDRFENLKCTESIKTLRACNSLHDSNGETDVYAEIDVCGRIIKLFIEDKIDSPEGNNQRARYDERAKRRGGEDAFVFLVAPKKYIEGQKYDYTVSYEELLNSVDSFERKIIQSAIDKYENGYTPVKDDKVTDLWGHITQAITSNSDIYGEIKYKNQDKGSKSNWICLHYSGFVMYIKTNKGCIDIVSKSKSISRDTFKDMAQSAVNHHEEVFFDNAGDSLVIRLRLEKRIDVHEPYEIQKDAIVSLIDRIIVMQGVIEEISDWRD